MAAATSASGSPSRPSNRRPKSTSGNGLYVENQVVHCRAASISAFILRTEVGQSREQGFTNDGVAYIQFDDFRNGRHELHVVVVQAMPGMHGETEGGSTARSGAQALELPAACGSARLRVAAGMQLDDLRTRPPAQLRSAAVPDQ